MKILRKRFIPNEVIDISRDEILLKDDNLLVTRWNAIHKRPDISYGVSFAFLKEGYKISRFYDGDRKFAYWYCDIIDVDYNAGTDTMTFTDLLLDIKILPDGKVLILDADELAEALEQGLIDSGHACRALRTLDKLLKRVNAGTFPDAVCHGFSDDPGAK